MVVFFIVGLLVVKDIKYELEKMIFDRGNVFGNLRWVFFSVIGVV